MALKVCKVCNKTQECAITGYIASSRQFVYSTPDTNRRWMGKKCPECYFLIRWGKPRRVLKVPKPAVSPLECVICYAAYKPRKASQTTCSKRCWKKLPGIKLKKKREAKLYRATVAGKSRKAIYRKAGKFRVKRAKPSWLPWKDLYEVYYACGPGMEVDHIIPLNHRDVCGLHVPWNLQIITREDNVLKSNKFNYTWENNEWKSIK